MCSIDWCAFTWEAFATLATGGAAVGGAIYVGMKQTAIAHKQTQILDHQVEVERATLRAGLFDRRFAVHKAIVAYVREAFTARGEDYEVSHDVLIAFNEKLEEATFLFNDKIRSEIVAVADLADKLLEDRQELRERRFVRHEDVAGLDDQVSLARKALREKSSALAEAMGEEMRLYIKI